MGLFGHCFLELSYWHFSWYVSLGLERVSSFFAVGSFGAGLRGYRDHGSRFFTSLFVDMPGTSHGLAPRRMLQANCPNGHL